ncbi:GNAT family N-acetyltransferase [Sneathiella sp. P13V-1]|uniref:GNAT family N-acetyltransferase n=1 Tax=Sneathiella sp. P13V-1 TaxID=2697366 RepID=UPI00187B7A11|nr:GNAT family N-acetyltransferase [Sneathiella sp. P13V-1]MBE7637047.1 GNAT family N-acetyltransferase [Sneathiella sp. P13V-1]
MPLKRKPEPNEDGLWPVTITYLKMTGGPRPQNITPPAIPHSIIRSENPTVSFYRYLYDAVGRDWGWTDRKKLSDEDLDRVIKDKDTEIYVLYVRGTPAGYAELNFKNYPAAVDLAYFGIMPEFIGMKMGPYFLNWAIEQAWYRDPDCITVNTCTLDHPKALPMYQRFGYVPYEQREVIIDPIADHD